MTKQPKEILEKYFGFDSFRGKQEEIINRIVNERKHSIVIMPTGGGKSLCYQVPALCFSGGTIVLSPLIALMQDQVDALRKKNIPATFINSTVDKKDKESRLDAFISGKIKMLYVTPERFRKKDFVEKIKTAKINLLAVDEAHCISEWGHDFRPDYSRIGEFRELLGNPLTVASTATATPDVQKDIITKLHIDPTEIKIFHEGIERPSLRLEVDEVMDDKEKLQIITSVLNKYHGSGIIYFTLIKTLEDFSEQLKIKKFHHGIYHGKLQPQQRKRLQRDFISGKTELMLATNAFGMGIDKPDIRFVLHAEVPSSVESYYQEIGRAGRDGGDSLCLMIYNQQDLYTQMEFIKWSNPGAEYYDRLYFLLKSNLVEANSSGLEYLREQMSFKDRFDFRLETALGMLDRYGVTDGSIETKNLEIVSELPDELTDDEVLKSKLMNDNKKLLSVVEYIRKAKCRKIFISDYFGFLERKSCKNCDACDGKHLL
ncbi:MAG: ATP-dependent DNA helicase RecQ [bacterium]